MELPKKNATNKQLEKYAKKRFGNDGKAKSWIRGWKNVGGGK